MNANGFFAQVLLKIGIIAVLAGFFPPAVQLYDLLTCERASAVIVAGQPFRPATVKFTTSDGREVTAKAATHHIGRRTYAVGDTVEVIYRASRPSSLAPHRKVQDSLIGLAALGFGLVLLKLRRRLVQGHRLPVGPDPHTVAAPPGVTSRRGERAPTASAPASRPIQSARPAQSRAMPVRGGSVQRERGWFGRA